MKVYLSYLLDEQSVVWPGEPTVQIRQTTSIDRDGYNSFEATLPNHHGTHMDGPRHFNPNGPSLMELPIEYFCFDHVAAIDVPKSKGEGVTQDDLKAWEPEIRSADLLLIKTGFCLQRDTQPRVYESEGPYLTPEACQYLVETAWEPEIRSADLLLIKTGFCLQRDTQPRVYESEGPYLTPEACQYLVETFPDLRAIGLDFLSVGTPANQLSRRAHQTLFGCHNGKFLPAIEDMDLKPLFSSGKQLKWVIVAPLRLSRIDSSQVTVIGELED